MDMVLKNLSKKIQIELSEEQILKLENFKTMLLEKNKVLNLTAITDEYEVILKHFIDSLTINKYIEDGKSLIDVGTGAGFPGIPIKIIRPKVNITLLDSLRKRLDFLNDVIAKNDLKDVRTVHGRAEDIAHKKEYREQYDYVTARAVANLSTLSELCLPFLKVGGTFICMKGSSVEEVEDARNAIKTLGGEIIKIDKFFLPESDIERNIILIKKIKSTSSKYPRKAGTPSKEPLK